MSRAGRAGRGPGLKLEGRERDRVGSEYMELLGSQQPIVRQLPGTVFVAVTVLASMAAVALVAVALHLLRAPTLLQFVAACVGVAAVLALAIAISTGVIGPRRSLWYAAMRRCGHDVCVTCGYWLAHRAPGASACPECGTPDDRQPVALGTPSRASSWPRLEVETAPDQDDRDAPDRRAQDDGGRS